MIELKNIKAKSDLYGKLDLQIHTKQVMEMAKIIAKGFAMPFDEELALKGAILHDIGKAHPYFQKRIEGYVPKSFLEKRCWDSFVHRHEISSLAFLPAFHESEWDILIEMVVEHHKSIENDKNKRGIIDLDNSTENDKWIEDHLQDWEEWFPLGQMLLNHFGYPCKEISKKQAAHALRYTLNYCKKVKRGWSVWRGLLKAADHYASAFNDKYIDQIEFLFQSPRLDFYFDENRKSDLYPLSTVSVSDTRRHTLVVAPTGAGKTDFLLKRTRGRIFYTLPFQASINAMYDRFRETIEPQKNIRLQHGTSELKVGNSIDERIAQSLVGASVKVLTPYQLATIIFGTKGYESIMLDVQACDIILDEIHTYSEVSQAMVVAIVKALLYLDCRIHIGTATMPKSLYNKLLEILGGRDEVYEVHLTDDQLVRFNRHKIFKHKLDFKDEEIQAIIKEALKNDEKVLLIFNTVKSAQEAFASFAQDKTFDNVPKMLIHSRFRRGDRAALEDKLKNKYNHLTGACMVIATQVVEVSLDISFDRMITEAAPLDSLVQRFGRINRKRTVETMGKYKPIHILSPKGSTLPYKKEVVEASFELLPDNGEVFEETLLQQKMDKVYPSIVLQSIDVHLKFKKNAFQMKKLTDSPHSILIEALEIDGAACILECDREKYNTSHWEERIALEIPINCRTLRPYKHKYKQLGLGSNPSVVPQDEEDYILYGLKLVEPDNFL